MSFRFLQRWQPLGVLSNALSPIILVTTIDSVSSGVTGSAMVTILAHTKLGSEPVPYLDIEIRLNGVKLRDARTGTDGKVSTGLSFDAPGVYNLSATGFLLPQTRVLGKYVTSGLAITVAGLTASALDPAGNQIPTAVSVDGQSYLGGTTLLYPLQSGPMPVSLAFPFGPIGDSFYALSPYTYQLNLAGPTSISQKYVRVVPTISGPGSLDLCQSLVTYQLGGLYPGGQADFSIDGKLVQTVSASASQTASVSIVPLSFSPGVHFATVKDQATGQSGSLPFVVPTPPSPQVVGPQQVDPCQGAVKYIVTGLCPSGGSDISLDGAQASTLFADATGALSFTLNPSALGSGPHTLSVKNKTTGASGQLPVNVSPPSPPTINGPTSLDPCQDIANYTVDSLCPNGLADLSLDGNVQSSLTADAKGVTSFQVKPAGLGSGPHTLGIRNRVTGLSSQLGISISQPMIPSISGPTYLEQCEGAVQYLVKSLCAQGAAAFDVDGVVQSTISADANGASSFSVNPSSLPVGNHTIGVTNKATGSVGKYNVYVDVCPRPPPPPPPSPGQAGPYSISATVSGPGAVGASATIYNAGSASGVVTAYMTISNSAGQQLTSDSEGPLTVPANGSVVQGFGVPGLPSGLYTARFFLRDQSGNALGGDTAVSFSV